MFTDILKFIFYLPIKLLVKTTTLPKDPVPDLNIDTGKPIVYVLKNHSISDLLALHFHCPTLSLPSPFKPLYVNGVKVPRYLFLYKTPLIFNAYAPHRIQGFKIFKQWVEIQKNNPSSAIQIITVPSMWNRSPGIQSMQPQDISGENLKLTSAWHRFKNVITRGRSHTVFISRPITLTALIQRIDFSNEEKAALVLERLCRSYFYRSLNTSHGPRLPIRTKLINVLIATHGIQKAIAESHDPNAEADARKKIDEIAADISYNLLTRVNSISKFICNRLYQGIKITGDEAVRSLAQAGHEIIYIPCHRSHMDYILLQYVIFNAGLMPPHVASGINLNFFPFGPFIRKCGAFFLRRKFNGDHLYTAIFREYVSFLCSHGYSMEFFIEGTRSRTGRLLHPKTGMLSMLVQTQLRGFSRPITIVPIYLAYEHVMEVNTYTKELSGTKKKAENIWQIFSIFAKLRNYGHGYVNFGEPITLTKYLDSYLPDWRSYTDPLGGYRPSWLYGCVTKLAHQVMFNLSEAAAVNGLTLSSIILLSSEHYTIEKALLRKMLGILNDILRLATISPFTRVIHTTPEKLLENALSLHKFGTSIERGTETITLLHQQYQQLTYYRNNILHLFIIPSVVIKLISLSSRLVYDELLSSLTMLFDLLENELFVPIKKENLQTYVRSLLRALVHMNLISYITGCYEINPAAAKECNIISAISNETLIRYRIFFTIISNNNVLSYEDLEESWTKYLSRICFDRHMELAPEFSSNETLKWLIAYLEENDYARQIGVNGMIKFDLTKLEGLSDLITSITDTAIQTNIPTPEFEA